MNLRDLLTEIKEENLTRDRLEAYEQQLSVLYAEMMMSIATLKKSRALYFYAKEQEHPELPDVKIKRVWDATDEGLSLIENEANVKAVSRMLGSIKSRIYQSY